MQYGEAGELHGPNVVAIPHICHFVYTTAIWGVEILHFYVPSG